MICDYCNVSNSSEHLVIHCKETETAKFTQVINEKYNIYNSHGNEAKLNVIINLKTNDTNIRDIICTYVKNICTKMKLV